MNNNLQTILEAAIESLVIRELQEEDLGTRVLWMNSHTVYNSMHFEIPVTLERTREWFRNNQGSVKRADMVVLEDDEVVAFCGITAIDSSVMKSELYIFVNPNLQGKGYGTKATLLLCRYAFEEKGMHKIFLETNEDNYAAQKVYERCGFKLEGRHRKEHLTKDGKWKDRLYYGLLKEEFMDV